MLLIVFFFFLLLSVTEALATQQFIDAQHGVITQLEAGRRNCYSGLYLSYPSFTKGAI